MIPYAGYDPYEGIEGYYPPKRTLRDIPRRQRAYVMFRAGQDTASIAAYFDVAEARVLEWVNLERSDFLGLPSPYEGPAP